MPRSIDLIILNVGSRALGESSRLSRSKSPEDDTKVSDPLSNNATVQSRARIDTSVHSPKSHNGTTVKI